MRACVPMHLRTDVLFRWWRARCRPRGTGSPGRGRGWAVVVVYIKIDRLIPMPTCQGGTARDGDACCIAAYPPVNIDGVEEGRGGGGPEDGRLEVGHVPHVEGLGGRRRPHEQAVGAGAERGDGCVAFAVGSVGGGGGLEERRGRGECSRNGRGGLRVGDVQCRGACASVPSPRSLARSHRLTYRRCPACGPPRPPRPAGGRPNPGARHRRSPPPGW